MTTSPDHESDTKVDDNDITNGDDAPATIITTDAQEEERVIVKKVSEEETESAVESAVAAAAAAAVGVTVNLESDESSEEKGDKLLNNRTDGKVEGDTITSSTSSSSVNGLLKQRQSVLRTHLTNGFMQMAERQKKSSRQQKQKEQQDSKSKKNVSGHELTNGVTIHILDPTQQPSGMNIIPSYSTTNLSNNNKQPRKVVLNSNNKGLNLYSALTDIFQRDYNSTLHSVPYPNLRTGTKELIDSIPLKPTMITHNSSSLLSVQTNATEWHVGPYCHVYIAACENLEHYRARVRPAIQAFVSQIQESNNIMYNSVNNRKKKTTMELRGTKSSSNLTSPKTSSNSSSSSNANNNNPNTAPPYVIVYVPLSKDSTSSTSGGLASKWGGFYDDSSPNTSSKTRALFGKGKLRKNSTYNTQADIYDTNQSTTDLTSTTSLDDDGSSSALSSNASNATNHSQFAMAAAAPPPGPVQTRKDVKELHKKICHDFPQGRTCILSTLITCEGGFSPLKNQEWNAFLRALGDAIVSGFRRRVARYNKELKQQDFMIKKTSDQSHYFLVKESLAFTYQQMQLPHQALLIYEELEAFLPQGALWLEEEELLKKNKREVKRLLSKASMSTKHLMIQQQEEDAKAEKHREVSLYDMASAGDIVGFRRRIRGAATDLKLWSHLILQYLFARQTHLLFQLERPVEIIRSAYSFVRTMYQLRLDAIMLLGTTSSKTKNKPIEKREEEEDEETKEQREKEVAALRLKKRAEAEAWSLFTCWDIKCACESYFNNWFLKSSNKINEDTESVKSTKSQQDSQFLLEREASCKLSDILSFARLRLLKLGDMELSENPIRIATAIRPKDTLKPWLSWEELRNLSEDEILANCNSSMRFDVKPGTISSPGSFPLHDVNDSKPPEMRSSGVLESSNMNDDEGVVTMSTTESNNHTILPSKKTKTNMSEKYTIGWLRGAFDSRESYEHKYLELSNAIITLLKRAERFRSAARLQGEEAEIYILRGEHDKAAETLLPVVDNCALDFWDRAYYWRLFRLVCCQRIVCCAGSKAIYSREEATALYLETLTRCFNPRLSVVAPLKTSLLMQRDLQHVVRCPDISFGHRLGISPFLETELIVNRTSTGRTSQTLPYVRRKLIQNYCFVGETFTVRLGLRSHLPRPINIDNIRLFLLALEDFERIHTAGIGIIHEEDAFRILNAKEVDKTDTIQEKNQSNNKNEAESIQIVEDEVEGKIRIKPGENVFEFEWVPMTVGEFVLAAVGIQWDNVHIIHESTILRRPINGVDVLPSEPTQNIELNPLFLIPGHIQNVRLLFEAGSDIVNSGSVELTCSDGLKLLPHGADSHDENVEWVDTLSLELEPCQPHSKIVLTTTVKSDPIKGYDDPHGILSSSPTFDRDQASLQNMHAKVTTSYHHSFYDELIAKGIEPDSPPMTTILEAMVTTLDRPALTVGRADAIPFSEDNVMVSVCLHCNTPVPFFLHEWNIAFPPPLAVAPNVGDLNENMFGHAVVEGEELYFGFKCIQMDMDSYSINGIHEGKRPILHVILRDEFGKTFRQVLPLDLDKYYAKMNEEDKYAKMNTVIAELRSSQDEGVVGAPVIFQYYLDMSKLTVIKKRMSSVGSVESARRESDPTPLLFNLICNPADWILGGKVQGLINRSQNDKEPVILEFTGVPTRSGVFSRFPEISLQYHETIPSKICPPIKVHTKYPEYYKSQSYTNHMALACPSTQEC